MNCEVQNVKTHPDKKRRRFMSLLFKPQNDVILAHFIFFSLFSEVNTGRKQRMANCSLCASSFSVISRPSSQPQFILFNLPPRTGTARFRCSAGQTGFFTKLGRLIKEKAKSDVEKIFSGFSKTRNNLAVVDELLLYWNLADTDRVLDQLEEVRVFTSKLFFVFIFRFVLFNVFFFISFSGSFGI